MSPLSTLEVVLLTGFVGFVTAICSHVLTKWNLAGQYVTRKEYDLGVRQMNDHYIAVLNAKHAEQVAEIQKLAANCQFNQLNCPIRDIQKDIIVIKGIQTKRTSDLEAMIRQSNRRRMMEINVFRAILEALSKNTHEQNEILGELVEYAA